VRRICVECSMLIGYGHMRETVRGVLGSRWLFRGGDCD